MKLSYALVAVPLLAAVTPVRAADWAVEPDKSHLGFSGVQSGAPFQGSFGKWTAEISFDPAHPDAGHIKAVIDIASAQTGDVQRDTSLPQPEWFSAKAFPRAEFEANGFVAKGGDAYEAPGKLTLRGISQDTVLPFTLTIAGNRATAKGHLILVRTTFGVGQGSWATDEFVALEVGVDVDVVATRSGG